MHYSPETAANDVVILSQPQQVTLIHPPAAATLERGATLNSSRDSRGFSLELFLISLTVLPIAGIVFAFHVFR